MPISIALPIAFRFAHGLVDPRQEFSCHICIRLSSNLLASVSDLTTLVFNFASDAELAGKVCRLTTVRHAVKCQAVSVSCLPLQFRDAHDERRAQGRSGRKRLVSATAIAHANDGCRTPGPPCDKKTEKHPDYTPPVNSKVQ
jgi:hypothetical protein